MVSLFIFPTGPTALDFEPRGRRYVKNMIYNRNRLATGSYALALGPDTKPGHNALVHPDSWRENLIFFTNRNMLHTLKKESLNTKLLHTSRTMDGPWIKTVPVASRIFDVSSSTGNCWKDELGNRTLGTKAQNMHQLRVFGSFWLPMVPSPYYSRAIHCPASGKK